MDGWSFLFGYFPYNRAVSNSYGFRIQVRSLNKYKNYTYKSGLTNGLVHSLPIFIIYFLFVAKTSKTRYGILRHSKTRQKHLGHL